MLFGKSLEHFKNFEYTIGNFFLIDKQNQSPYGKQLAIDYNTYMKETHLFFGYCAAWG